jgi:signal transduction histidine kinase
MTLPEAPASPIAAAPSREPRDMSATAELVVEIAVATAGERQLDQILQMTLDRLRSILPFTGGSIALIDVDELVIRAAVGPFAAGALGQRLRQGSGRSWQVIETQTPVLLGDILGSGGIVRNPDAVGQLHSWLAVPLVRAGEPIGLLEVDSTERQAFTQDDVRLMEIVARALSGPVELASLYHQLEAREHQQAAVAELGRLVLEHPDVELLRNRASELVADTLDVEHAAVYEVQPDGTGLRMVAAKGIEVPLVPELIVSSGRASQAGYTIASGGPVILADVATEQRFELSRQVRRLGIVSGVSTPIGTGDQLSGVVSAHTKRRRNFSRDDVNFLVAVANVLAVAKQRASQADSDRRAQALQDAFIGVVSHELRTPITTIYGNSKVLRRRLDHLDPEALAQIVDDIEAEADRLQRLIEDLLVLSRAERGAVEVTNEPILLTRILERTVAAERERWPSHVFELAVPSVLPSVAGEETYVEQVVRNLLTNAAKYSPVGSTVRVQAETVDDDVVVRVLDQGPGIDPQEVDRLFDVFYRSALAVRTAAGSGIGLFVCRELLHAMNGRIWARNREGGGSEFAFSLSTLALDDELVQPPLNPVSSRS